MDTSLKLKKIYEAGIYLFKVNYGNIRAMCEIRSKLRKKQQNDVNERRSSVVNVNFAQI